jgi:hypothetical protein
MALSNAEKERRWREKRNEAAQNDPDAVERMLLQEVERYERGELSDQERAALADKLADMAMDFLRRSQRLARMARKLSGIDL